MYQEIFGICTECRNVIEKSLHLKGYKNIVTRLSFVFKKGCRNAPQKHTEKGDIITTKAIFYVHKYLFNFLRGYCSHAGKHVEFRLIQVEREDLEV